MIIKNPISKLEKEFKTTKKMLRIKNLKLLYNGEINKDIELMNI